MRAAVISYGALYDGWRQRRRRAPLCAGIRCASASPTESSRDAAARTAQRSGVSAVYAPMRKATVATIYVLHRKQVSS